MAGVSQESGDAPQVLVQVIDQRCVKRHVTRIDLALFVRHISPVWYTCATFGKARIGRHQAHRQLILEASGPHGIPTGVVAACVAHDVGGLGVQGRMRRVVGQVEEEGLAGRSGPVLLEPTQRFVGPVVGAIVVSGVAVAGDDGVVLKELGWRKVVRFAANETVEPVEAALQRPGSPIARRRDVVLGGVVPFADRIGGVTLRTQ